MTYYEQLLEEAKILEPSAVATKSKIPKKVGQDLPSGKTAN